MRLSQAMMLGSTVVKLRTGDLRYCAYGAALRSEGARPAYSEVIRLWPWTQHGNDNYLCELGVSVYQKFDLNVCNGEMTFEQLVDYVRSIEPECGECNRFECICPKQQAEQLVEVYAPPQAR